MPSGRKQLNAIVHSCSMRKSLLIVILMIGFLMEYKMDAVMGLKLATVIQKLNVLCWILLQEDLFHSFTRWSWLTTHCCCSSSDSWMTCADSLRSLWARSSWESRWWLLRMCSACLLLSPDYADGGDDSSCGGRCASASASSSWCRSGCVSFAVDCHHKRYSARRGEKARHEMAKISADD